MPDHIAKTGCDRCGTCCTKGGPALHEEDGPLLQNKRLTPEHLVTIRKGEPVFSLSGADPEPARSEIVKIKGKGVEWTCFFYQEKEGGCAIYEHRPLECSLLKCWETADLEKIAGRNLLNRYAIIAPQDPVLPFIKLHDEICSLENLARMLAALKRESSQHQSMSALTDLVNSDLAIRSQALARFHFSLDLELFFFGRPLFMILKQFGLNMHEENGVYSLSLASSSLSAL